MEHDTPHLPVQDQLNKAQKFVRLVELMQHKHGIQAEEAMRIFELDSRTLRRYLADLPDCKRCYSGGLCGRRCSLPKIGRFEMRSGILVVGAAPETGRS